MSTVWKIVIAVAACLLAGFAGSIVTAPAIVTWYAGLAKPSFTPPGWVFGPAWTLLYILMGIAAGLVWGRGLDAPGVRPALRLFVLQLGLNVAWSFLFFGLRSPALGLLDIVLLWLAILATIVSFGRIAAAPAWLLAPYLAWVSFATVLNFSILRLN